MTIKTTGADIQHFLAHKRLAVIGVSRDSKDFANMLFREFKQEGYNAIPVNPNAQELEGERCYARVQDISPTPDAALILTSLAASEQVVKDCAEAGIKAVWLYGVTGENAVNAQALAYARAHGLEIIPGFCPFMFLPKSPWWHKAHGLVARLTGGAPN